MTTEIIYGSPAFIARDRNPGMEPAQWPFRRAAGIEARSGETVKQGSTRRAKARSEGAAQKVSAIGGVSRDG